jgi:hypothetical protein
MRGTSRPISLIVVLLALSLLPASAGAQSPPPNPTAAAPAETQDADSGGDATVLAKTLQNPVGDLYSFPFQSNTNFNTGPHNLGARRNEL